MSRFARSKSDLSSVVSLISSLDSNLKSESLCDCYRLGKFDSNRRKPRPILVKFIRVADASSVLSKRGKLKPPYFIKPDMSLDERRQESILMKERWLLIQSGVSRQSIKIRNSSLLVDNKLHGKVVGCIFKSAENATPLSGDGNGLNLDTNVPTPITDSTSPLQSPVVIDNVTSGGMSLPLSAGAPVDMLSSGSCLPLLSNSTDNANPSQLGSTDSSSHLPSGANATFPSNKVPDLSSSVSTKA